MSKAVLRVLNLWKKYQLGNITPQKLQWSVFKNNILPKSKNNQTRQYSQDEKTLIALKDISFNLFEGDTLGIIGKNGAGKSTLLKLLSKVTAPSSGEIRMRGRVASLLEVGTGFHQELSGKENIFLNGMILGMSKMEVRNKLEEIIDFSGIEKFIDTPVKRYSSGMAVRLAFSVAAHLQAEILIMDEVLAVGDAEFQKNAMGKWTMFQNREGQSSSSVTILEQ